MEEESDIVWERIPIEAKMHKLKFKWSIDDAILEIDNPELFDSVFDKIENNHRDLKVKKNLESWKKLND